MLTAYVLGIEPRFRGAELVAELNQRGLSVQCVWGVDAKRPSNTPALDGFIQHRLTQLVHGRPLLLGEVACYLGHISCYQAFLKSSEPWALVLEDDVRVLSVEPVKKLAEILKHCKLPAVVQVHGHEPNNIPFQRFRKQAQIFQDPTIAQSLEVKALVRPRFGTSAYLINRAAAHFAIDTFSEYRIYSPIDWPQHWHGKVHFWTMPAAFDHATDGVNSEIDATSRGTFAESISLGAKLRETLGYVTGVTPWRGLVRGGPFWPLYRYGLIIAYYRVRALVRVFISHASRTGKA